MINTAIDAARKVGRLQLDYINKFYYINKKSERELVSEIDFKSQEIAEKILKQKYDFQIISEEKEWQKTEEIFWVIDPLDGTHNFIRKIPNFGVSISLVKNEEFEIGVIYLPFFDKMIYAQKNKGAFCNGKIIKVSNNKLKDSVINYDNQFYLHKNAFENYRKLTEKVFTTRISGSAIYDISLIATGNIEARVWNKSKIYDFAAGITIINEAGGKMTDFKGKKITTKSNQIIASNNLIHNEIIAILESEK